jgi:alkylation response protein AidB-like acyl-CoA dehydrogenase
LADTLDYIKTRQQFGTAIGSFQTIQHRMARLFTACELCRSLVMAAADRGGARLEWLRRVDAAQALTAAQGLHLAHECVQFHGGMGITHELAVSKGHRQLMVLARQSWSGASDAP